MQILQSRNFDSLFDQRANAARRGVSGGKRCDTRNVVANGGAANRFFIVEGFASERRIDDQVAFAGLNQVNDVGAALIYFEDALGLYAGGVQSRGGAASSGKLKPERRKFFSDRGEMFFVAVVDAEKDRSFAWQALPGGQLRFGESLAIRRRYPHNFTGRAHFRAENSVHAAEFVEWKDRR